MPKREKTRDQNIFIINGAFYFRGTIGGIRVDDEKLNASNFTQAKAKKEELIRKYQSQGVEANKLQTGILLDDYLQDREREFKSGEIRTSTISETRSLIQNHIKPYFGKYAVSEVEDTWPAYKRKKQNLDLSNHRKVLSHFLGWCKHEKYLKYKPELYFKKPERDERLNLSQDEIVKLFSVLTSNLRVICSMALLMGMRGSEITNLTWDRIDFESNALFLGKADTKTKRARSIPLNPTVKQMLEVKLSLSESRFVFPNQRDLKRPMAKGSYRTPLVKALKRAKITREISLHDLRATYEHYAHLNPNFSDTQLEKFLGASIDVQKSIYVKMGADQLRPLASAVNIPELQKVFQENWGLSGEKNAKKKGSKRAKA